MMSKPLSLDERRDLVGHDYTLELYKGGDKKPFATHQAWVSGAQLAFAQVSTREGHNLQWSWEAVATCASRDKRFKHTV